MYHLIDFFCKFFDSLSFKVEIQEIFWGGTLQTFDKGISIRAKQMCISSQNQNQIDFKDTISGNLW